MFLNYMVFIRGQLAGFGEDRVRDADLADVVKIAGVANRMQLGSLETKSAGNSLGIKRDAFRMAPGVCVLGIDSFRERTDGAHEGVLEILIDSRVLNRDGRFVGGSRQQVHLVVLEISRLVEINANDADTLPLGQQWQSYHRGIALYAGKMFPGLVAIVREHVVDNK